MPDTAQLHLHWIPLGAGQRVVRASGFVFEAFSALVQRRQRCHLYHSALTVAAPPTHVIIEMAPVPDGEGTRRGVVAEGPVGLRLAGRFRLFRYEIRRWSDGNIPDLAAATSTLTLEVNNALAEHLLELVPSVPTPVWGRNELNAGEMWNSNSVTSWLLARSGIDVAAIALPDGGRAPGWDAGIAVALRP